MRDVNDLTAVSYKVDSIGKIFSDSKTRHTWTMDVDGDTVVLVVIASWNSNKFVVELNGYERFHQTVSGLFTYSMKCRDRFFKLQQVGETINLLIDTVPFAQFSARSKAAQAMMLKTYAASRSPAEWSGSGQEPLSGDLAKRLGKDGNVKSAGYVSQEDIDDEEDFFAVPVNIQSYVTPIPAPVIPGDDGTVFPNLIDFSTPNAPPEAAEFSSTTPVVGPVTPRDRISPSKLENPFAAFDELSKSVEKSNPFSSI